MGDSMRGVIALAGAVTIFATTSGAGPIGKACLGSQRSVSPTLCGCIQSVADRTLTGADQKQAARFFADPDKAEEIKGSDSRRNKTFWARYQSFAVTAGAVCATG